MSIFTDISDQWQIADTAFSTLEGAAFAANDDAAYDLASDQRKRNDQAYFLFLFTRFEQAINEAARVIIQNRSVGPAWQDSRIWEAWKALVMRDERNMHLMSKVEVVVDKSTHSYEIIKGYHSGRNNIGHGGVYTEQFVIPQVASFMHLASLSFPTL